MVSHNVTTSFDEVAAAEVNGRAFGVHDARELSKTSYLCAGLTGGGGYSDGVRGMLVERATDVACLQCARPPRTGQLRACQGCFSPQLC